MALDNEGVVNGGVDADEALGGAGRLEALQLPFSPPHRQVRNLSPVVLAQVSLMPRKAELGKRAPQDRSRSVLKTAGAKPCFPSGRKG
jgi:hypothetical protein